MKASRVIKVMDEVSGVSLDLSKHKSGCEKSWDRISKVIMDLTDYREIGRLRFEEKGEHLRVWENIGGSWLIAGMMRKKEDESDKAIMARAKLLLELR
jgi:hypothetical protein